MKQRLLIAGSCLLAAAAIAAGCGGSDNGGSGNDQGGTPATSDAGDHKGGTLTMLWSAPGQSIDTAIARVYAVEGVRGRLVIEVLKESMGEAWPAGVVWTMRVEPRDTPLSSIFGTERGSVCELVL